MTKDIIARLLNDSEYDTERSESLREMVRDAFAQRMRSLTLVVAGFLIVFIAFSVWMAVLFFQATDIWHIVFYATIFNTLMLAVAATRIFLWQTLHRGRLQRDIRRLELRILELANSLPSKPEERPSDAR